MALSERDLPQLAQVLAESADLRAAAGELRSRYAPMRAMVVDPLDLRDEAPALRAGARALYLVATDGHCWTVTAEPAAASGFILSEG